MKAERLAGSCRWHLHTEGITLKNARLPFPKRRMLDEAHAADYLGLPIAVFKRECPVQAVRIGRHVRWDRYALDAWVDSFSKTDFDQPREYWLALLDGGIEKEAREREARADQRRAEREKRAGAKSARAKRDR